jgi:hypothetical protein
MEAAFDDNQKNELHKAAGLFAAGQVISVIGGILSLVGCLGLVVLLILLFL